MKKKNIREPLLSEGAPYESAKSSGKLEADQLFDSAGNTIENDPKKNRPNVDQMFGKQSIDIDNINVDCKDNDCQFMKESKSCIPIKNLDDEIKYYNENDILQKPVEIYLDHC